VEIITDGEGVKNGDGLVSGGVDGNIEIPGFGEGDGDW
jgi:hypothetical protein